MVLSAPELVVSQPVKLFDKIKITPELEHWIFAEGMVGREK